MEEENKNLEENQVQPEGQAQDSVQVSNDGANKKKNNFAVIIGLLVVVIAVGVIFVGAISVFSNQGKDKSKEEKKDENVVINSEYKMSGNSLSDFDLFFLREENELKNKVYSPLSIKYALAMLNEGADGETKAQISAVIGDYKNTKYINSKNLSLANGLFIKESLKDNIKSDYVNNLQNKYNASVFYDSFTSPDNVNKWVSDNTFNLIPNLVDNINDKDFVLINVLAIDMEWVNKIQSETEDYDVHYPHEDFYTWVTALNNEMGYTPLKFSSVDYDVKSVEIASAANRYDIIKDLTEKSIRDNITKEYSKFYNDKECGSSYDYEPIDSYVNQYIKEVGTGYGQVSSSTDFSFYVDDSIKVFAKDLKEYDGTTLQYVGIMPTTETLDKYISNISYKKIDEIIANLKDASNIESYTDGKISNITGNIPVFNLEYELALLNDLKKMGITDVFDMNKADLSKLTSAKGTYIDTAIHKANIEFSNDGIKAAAATMVGGKGAADCGFDYLYKVPIENIDLTFNKPFMFLIRDKKTGEIWFTGTVYEPIKITDIDMYGPEYEE